MQTLKKILYCALFNCSALYSITPYYNIRSQSVNLAREVAGETNFTNLHNQQQTYGTLVGIVEYQQSFNPNAITRSIFGCDVRDNLCSSNPGIVISGSQTLNRGEKDWLADYFGLATDFKSRVTFKPVIKNIIFDLDFYIGLDLWAEGLYFAIRAPITQTKWYMDMHETVSAVGNNNYAAGYFSANADVGTLDSFTQFITGNDAPLFTSATLTDGDTFPATVYEPLANAKISKTPIIRAALAELQIAIGWNYCRPDWHVGISTRLRAPTGLHPQGEFAFEPMVGNSHHWEFGGQLSGHWDFWHNECDTRHAGIFVDAIVTHMFTARQHRTFDLVGKPNSRYMLAQKLGTDQLTTTLSSNFPALEFQSEVTPVANLTTMDVDVTIPVQGELVIMGNYTHDNISFDLGYNFWGRACENIKKKGCPSALECCGEWALKGDAAVIGFEDTTNDPVRLAATESNATIHAGTNFPAGGTTNSIIIAIDETNPNIDAPSLAVSNNGNTIWSQPSGILQTRSSNPPVLLTLKDVDFSAAATKGISNKLFTHVSYIWWHTCSHWVPYLGLGGEVEFGNRSSCKTSCSDSSSSCGSGCSTCNTCAVSQWGIWLKGGAAF